ncbi:MAG: sugar phosphate nucleotidyltransferase, partial [Bdellovibrionales bacterium]|nr:sugar phosphate nucleotidyltransferase [Bdellovibrionales bacterium]
DFLQGDDSVMVLGDNVFYGNFSIFRQAAQNQMEKSDGLKGRVFAYPVKNPEAYGVVEFEKQSLTVVSIEEKPQSPKSQYAIPGIYFLDGSASERAKNMKPSARGELEITDLIKTYLAEEQLGVELFSRGMAWFDTGTPQSLLEASAFIGAIEQRQGQKVACLEEIALRLKYLNVEQFKKNMERVPTSSYKDYLKLVLEEIE